MSNTSLLPQLSDQEVRRFFQEGSRSARRKWSFAGACCVASLLVLKLIPFGQTNPGGAVVVVVLILSLLIFLHVARRRYLASRAMRHRIISCVDRQGCLFSISAKAVLFVNPKSSWFGYDVIAISRIFGWSYKADVLKITPKDLEPGHPQVMGTICSDFSNLPQQQRQLVAAKLKELLKNHPDMDVGWAKYWYRNTLIWISVIVIFVVFQIFEKCS